MILNYIYVFLKMVTQKKLVDNVYVQKIMDSGELSKRYDYEDVSKHLEELITFPCRFLGYRESRETHLDYIDFNLKYPRDIMGINTSGKVNSLMFGGLSNLVYLNFCLIGEIPLFAEDKTIDTERDRFYRNFPLYKHSGRDSLTICYFANIPKKTILKANDHNVKKFYKRYGEDVFGKAFDNIGHSFEVIVPSIFET